MCCVVQSILGYVQCTIEALFAWEIMVLEASALHTASNLVYVERNPLFILAYILFIPP